MIDFWHWAVVYDYTSVPDWHDNTFDKKKCQLQRKAATYFQSKVINFNSKHSKTKICQTSKEIFNGSDCLKWNIMCVTTVFIFHKRYFLERVSLTIESSVKIIKNTVYRN